MALATVVVLRKTRTGIASLDVALAPFLYILLTTGFVLVLGLAAALKPSIVTLISLTGTVALALTRRRDIEWVVAVVRRILARFRAVSVRPMDVFVVSLVVVEVARIAKQLMGEVSFTAIRGNAAEMAVLAGVEAEIRGVDSLSVSGDVAEIAASLSSAAGCVAAVTGEVDVVSDGARTARVFNGHALLGRVTGTGCMATTAIAVFLAAGKPYLEATAGALAVFGLAGEKAAGSSGRLPGSFHVELYNTLYEISAFRKLKGIKLNLS